MTTLPRRWSLRLLFVTLGLLGASLKAAEPAVIDIWPEGVPDPLPHGTPEYIKDDRVYCVQHPTLTYYPAPADKANGTAVICCPGGGYVRLNLVGEGMGSVRWLNALGVSVFILKYRVTESPYPAAMRDILRSVRLLRSRAKEFGINPDRLGVYGASAGGHVAACAGTLYEAPEGKTGNPLDTVSARPDFLILQYPLITLDPAYSNGGSREILLGKNPTDEQIRHISLNLHVTKDTPPTFIIATQGDKSVKYQHELLFYSALRDAGVPTELHLYQNGPHGFGFDASLGPTSEWPKAAEAWLRFNGWLPASSAAGTGDSKLKKED